MRTFRLCFCWRADGRLDLQITRRRQKKEREAKKENNSHLPSFFSPLPAMTAATGSPAERHGQQSSRPEPWLAAEGEAKAAPHVSADLKTAYLPSSAASDEALVARLTDLVNTVYAADEAGFWKDDFVRTSTDEVAACLRTGELAAVWRPSSSAPEDLGPKPSEIVGCVRIHMLDTQTGEFGMLVCDQASRGTGVGRRLLTFAEEEVRRRGAQFMRLELLFGDGWTHALKQRLGTWYERAGYELIRTGSIRESFPQMAPMMARPSIFRVYQKVL